MGGLLFVARLGERYTSGTYCPASSPDRSLRRFHASRGELANACTTTFALGMLVALRRASWNHTVTARGEALSTALLRLRGGRLAEGSRRGGDEDELCLGAAPAAGGHNDVQQDAGRRQIDGGGGLMTVEAMAEQGGRQSQADDGQGEDRGARDALRGLGALNVLGLEEDETDRQQAQRRQKGGFPAEQAAADRQGQDSRGKREDDWREESHGR